MWKDGKTRPRPWRVMTLPDGDRHVAKILAGNSEVVATSSSRGVSEEDVSLRISVAKAAQGFSSRVEKLEHGQYVAYAGADGHYFKSEIMTNREYAEKIAADIEKLIKTTY